MPASIWLLVRRDRLALLAAAFPIAYWLSAGRTATVAPFIRYTVPLAPPLAVAAAVLSADLLRRPRWRPLAMVATAIVVGTTLLWAVAYMNVFRSPDSRLAASQWLLKNVPRDSKILIEPSQNTPPMGSYLTAVNFHDSYVMFYPQTERHDYYWLYPLDTYRSLFNRGVDDNWRRNYIQSRLALADWIVMDETFLAAVPAPAGERARRGEAVLPRPVRRTARISARQDLQGVSVAVWLHDQRRSRRVDVPVVRPSARVHLPSSMTGSTGGHPRFLVTGGTGFIGRRLVRRLIADSGPASIVCLVKPPVTPLEAAALEAYRSQGLRLIEGDLAERAGERRPAARRSTSCFISPPTSTPTPPRTSSSSTTRARATCSTGSRRCRAARESSTRARWPFTIATRLRPRRSPKTSPFVPRTAYGRTKLKGEHILQESAGRDGYSWTILRLPTVYGPGQKPGGLFDKMIRMASAGALLGRIDWPGRTSIIHVDDAAM